MKALLTNDDGYTDPGLWELALELANRGAQVTVVAPERQRSAVSHALTLHKPLRLMRATELDRENITVYYSNGTPTDCAMLGMFEVLPDADVVMSGINSGPNLGEDVLYSGTVAGAMEGAMLGSRAISVSLSEYGSQDYRLAARFAAGLAFQLAASKLPKKTVLNVNVPPVPPEQYKGFKVVPLGTRKYTDVLQKRTDPRGREYFWVTGQLVRGEISGDSDGAAVENGFVSITPLSLDFTDHSLISSCRFSDPING